MSPDESTARSALALALDLVQTDLQKLLAQAEDGKLGHYEAMDLTGYVRVLSDVIDGFDSAAAAKTRKLASIPTEELQRIVAQARGANVPE